MGRRIRGACCSAAEWFTDSFKLLLKKQIWAIGVVTYFLAGPMEIEASLQLLEDSTEHFILCGTAVYVFR